jgi:festuclavine dehydrogenase
MAILLTGGTGKTSTQVARLLQDEKTPFLLASRRGEDAAPAGMPATKFDWLDSSTYGNPFNHEVAGGKGFSAIYLVAPDAPDPVEAMNAFLDFAVKEHSVKHFVLLADSTKQLGGPHLGQVWQHLIDLGVEYCVLRPTWFMGKFALPTFARVSRLMAKSR